MPSAALAERIEKEEEQRVADQVKKLGPEGLAKAQQELDEAKAAHDEANKSDVVEKTHLINHEGNGHANGHINGHANGIIAVGS